MRYVWLGQEAQCAAVLRGRTARHSTLLRGNVLLDRKMDLREMRGRPGERKDKFMPQYVQKGPAEDSSYSPSVRHVHRSEFREDTAEGRLRASPCRNR